MGWAKYTEDNNEIRFERLRNREQRERQEDKYWTRDSVRLQKITSMPKSHENEKKRVEELLEIKESLFYKINLSLAVANSMHDNTVRCIVNSLTRGLEDSCTKVGKALRTFECLENVTLKVCIPMNEIKLTLIKNVFYKIERIINNSDVISKQEIEGVLIDISRLVNWYYKKETTIGRIGKELASEEQFRKFLEEELDTKLCVCPICGRNTIDGWKFCIECAEEW